MSDYEFKWLSLDDLTQQQVLEDAVMQKLAASGREHFFTPLSQDRKIDIIKRGDLIAGLWQQGELVGQMVVEEAIFPNTFFENYTTSSICSLGISPTESYYLRNSLMHPAMQGKKMLEDMFDWIVNSLSPSNDYYTVIHPANIPSIRLGQHIGFSPAGSLVRLKDGQQMNLYKRLSLSASKRFVA